MLTCNDYIKCFYTKTLWCREEAMNTRRNRHIGRVSGIHGEEDGLVLSGVLQLQASPNISNWSC